MGTISDKLTYLNTTKSQLKDMINYGLPTEQQITSSTTFREYVSSIFNAFLEALRTPDTLFTNLPKKSGSGANITLNDTANAPMRIELGASELTQDGTPTPSSPQAVHTISGSNKVVVFGKNLFDVSKISTGTFINTSTGAETTNNVWNTSDYISVGNATSITTSNSILADSSNRFEISEYNENKQWISSRQYGNNTALYFNLNLNANTKYIRIGYRNDLNFTNIQVELGTITNPTYEPYTSQEADIDLGDIEYCKIGNYEDKFIRTSGKNLFDATSFGAFTSTIKYISLQLEPNTSYTMSSNIPTGAGDVSNVFLITSTGDATTSANGVKPNSPRTITTLNDGIIRIGYRDNDGTLSDEATKYWYMLNEGTSTDYEPYGTNEWYIKKNIGKVVLDGSETDWTLNNSGTPNYSYRLSIPGQIIGGNGISNLYPFVSSIYDGNTTEGFNIFNSSTTYYQLRIRYGTEQTLPDFKTFLGTNNLIIYYILATPTYTQITGTLAEQLEYVYQKMLSYKGVTNISQVNNDLPFVLDVQAIENLE